MNKIKGYLLIIFGTILIMIGTNSATWYWGRSAMADEKDAEWKAKIAAAPAETLRTEVKVQLPGQKVIIPGKPVILTVEDVRRIDSLIASSDSLRGLVFELARTQRGEKEDSTVKVVAYYFPLDRIFDIDWEHKPIRVPVEQITKQVLVEPEEPWLMINGGAGYNAGRVYGFAEANVVLRDRLYVVPRWDTYAGASVELGYTLIEW